MSINVNKNGQMMSNLTLLFVFFIIEFPVSVNSQSKEKSKPKIERPNVISILADGQGITIWDLIDSPFTKHKLL